MFKRLIIIGIPCSKEAWAELFITNEYIKQEIISFIDIFEKYYYLKKNMVDLVEVLSRKIQSFKPDQIVLHDIGVALGISAILDSRKNGYVYPNDVMIFNGTFKFFDIIKNPHPFRIQTMSYDEFEQEVIKHNGQIDLKYKKNFSGIKEFYQKIIEMNQKALLKYGEAYLDKLLEQAHSYPKMDLGGEVSIIASQNDPYIHFKHMELLERTIKNSILKGFDYGHFPYSVNDASFLELINKF